MASQILKYYDQRVNHLFTHLHEFDLHAEEAALHDFRVEMKKLRAIIKFLRATFSHRTLKKSAHILRSVFQASGEIREYQLLQQWCRKHELLIIENTYFPQFKLEYLLQEFRDRLPTYKKDLKLAISNSRKFVADTRTTVAKQYISNLQKQLESNCSPTLSTNHWHDLRKIIKQWMYALNWLAVKGEKKNPDFSYFNKLQEHIGQWHDMEMIKDDFSRSQIFLSHNLPVQKDFVKGWHTLMLELAQTEQQVRTLLKNPENSVDHQNIHAAL